MHFFFSNPDVVRLCHRPTLCHPLLGVVVNRLMTPLAVDAQIPIFVAPGAACTWLENVMHL